MHMMCGGKSGMLEPGRLCAHLSVRGAAQRQHHLPPRQARQLLRKRVGLGDREGCVTVQRRQLTEGLGTSAGFE